MAPEMFMSTLKETVKKVYSKNDIIFIEKEITHIVSEHAPSGKCDDFELNSAILGNGIIVIEIVGEMQYSIMYFL